MELEFFQKNFKNNEINIKPYLIVVSIFISIILIIVFFNRNIEDYYITKANIKNKEIKVIIDDNNLEHITDNKKMKIGRDIFTYKIKKIEDYISNGIVYKEVTLNIINYDYSNLIENNIIEVKIIINKTNILDYIIKTLKGE